MQQPGLAGLSACSESAGDARESHGTVDVMFGSARLYSLESLRGLKDFVGQTGRAIDAGRMLPGYSIELDRTADELSIPQAKVRHALQTLEADGLLDFPEPGRAVVAPLNVRELNRVFTVRRAVEPDVLATAARESPRGGFADLHAVSNGFATVDWNSDDITTSHVGPSVTLSSLSSRRMSAA
jgi:hypothetical protein